MLKTSALTLMGVVLAFAAARAETCKAPNVARVEMVSGATGGPLLCPPVGFCFHVSEPQIVSAYLRISCFVPAQEFEAMKAYENLGLK